jgi:hypothetical protein
MKDYNIGRQLMEGFYDVVFTLGDIEIFKTDGVPSLANAISILESIHLRYEIGTIYGYDQKGLRYIVFKREKHLSINSESVA